MKKKIIIIIIIKSTHTYGCKIWTTISVIEERLRTFENKGKRFADQFGKQGQMNGENTLKIFHFT